MNKKSLITILTILGLAIIAGGFWYAKNQQKENVVIKEKQEQNQQMNNEKENENQMQEEQKNENENGEELDFEKIDTSNWKEYCNKEYGFCVKYPEGWEYRDIKKIDKVWSMGFGKHGKYYEIEGGGDNAVNIFISPITQQNNNTVPHILRVWQDLYDITINKVKINNIVGYYYSGFGEGIIFSNILNHKDVKISSIIMTTPKIKHDIQPILQNIISSFKIIK